MFLTTLSTCTCTLAFFGLVFYASTVKTQTFVTQNLSTLFHITNLFALSWFVIFGITIYTRFRCGRCLKGLIFLWVRSTSTTGFFRVTVTPLTKGLHKLRVIPLLLLVIQTNKICSDIRKLIEGTTHKRSDLVKLSQCFQCLDLTCMCLVEFVHFAWISSLNLG